MTVRSKRNVAICIGCDDYALLQELGGAEADSEAFYEALTASGLYDTGGSRLLLSPTIQEARSCLNEIAAYKDLTVLTFYFAGHGAIKSGTFYLCFSDSDPDRFSTTSLPAVDLFTVISEIQPRQVNFVIDACQSAGAMFDLNALMKPDVIGRAGSSSIAFLAASASDQYAAETSSGGIATTAALKYLSGERQLQQNRPYLDLVEVGLAVSRDVLKGTPEQSPVAWGLNLYGDGILSTNPHYAPSVAGPPFSVEGIAPASATGQLVRQYAEPLWEEYRAIVKDHDPRRLQRTVLKMRAELGDDFVSFIRGYAPALASRASTSEDLLAASDALSVCAIALLQGIDEPMVLHTCRELLRTRSDVDHYVVTNLITVLESDNHRLLGRGYALPDLHYLPMRVSQLLAWISLARLSDSVLGINDPIAIGNLNTLVKLVFQHYHGSFVAVSDEQASWTMLFGALSKRFGWSEQLKLLAERLFATNVAVAGRVLRPWASGKDAFYYTLTRARMEAPIGYEELANPTELLSVLLLLAHRLDLSDHWDRTLSAFDGITLNAYVPDSYSQFGEPIIVGGNNFTYRVGHDVWTVREYVRTFDASVRARIQTAANSLGPEAELLCGLAAYIFPDRVPYFMI